MKQITESSPCTVNKAFWPNTFSTYCGRWCLRLDGRDLFVAVPDASTVSRDSACCDRRDEAPATSS
jgi:hypothetical protein